jgi:hypothetical protein
MKRTNIVQGGIAILMAIFMLALSACPQDSDDSSPGGGETIKERFDGSTGTIKYGTPVIKDSAQKYIDPKWNSVTSVFPLEKIYETDTNMEFWVPGSTTGIGRALWDETGVYVYVKVTDGKVDTEGSATHEQDSVELFINEAVQSNGDVITTPKGIADKGGQYRVSADGLSSGDPTAAAEAMTKVSGWRTSEGYIVIFHAPWRFKDQYPLKNGKKIGFELQINACSDGSRDGAVVWQNTFSGGYQDVTNYGVVSLDAAGAPSFEVKAALPAISGHPLGASYASGATATALTVTAVASDGGTLSYQWYSNSEDSYDNGALISSEGTGPSCTPAITTGTTYYWVEVKNTKDGNTSAAVRSNRAAIIVVAGDYIEEITTDNGAYPVYKFTLPEGSSFGDYTKISAQFKVNTENLALSVRARALGNYTEDLFVEDGNISYNDPDKNGPFIICNLAQDKTFSDASIGITAADTWTKLEFPLTGKEHGSFAAANRPDSTAAGTFYFALGFARSGGGNKVTYKVKKVTLESADGSKKVLSTGAGILPGFVSYGDTQVRTVVEEPPVLVEKISTRGSCARAFQFTLPAGKTWAEYTKLTYTVMVADQASWDWTSIRMYVAGSYAATDFGNDGAHSSSDWGSERLITVADNSTFATLLAATTGDTSSLATIVTEGAAGPKDWATIEHPASKFAGGFKLPEATDTGPFIFAFGPTVNPNNHSAQADKEKFINYYIKDVALVQADGTALAADTGVNFWTKFNTEFGEANTVMAPESETE